MIENLDALTGLMLVGQLAALGNIGSLLGGIGSFFGSRGGAADIEDAAGISGGVGLSLARPQALNTGLFSTAPRFAGSVELDEFGTAQIPAGVSTTIDPRLQAVGDAFLNQLGLFSGLRPVQTDIPERANPRLEQLRQEIAALEGIPQRNVIERGFGRPSSQRVTQVSGLTPAQEQRLGALRAELGQAPEMIGGGAQTLFEPDPDAPSFEEATLAELRGLAEPEERRALQGLENRLFSRGQLGSTAGGIQLEAFERARALADLRRQLTARQEARATQQSLFQGALAPSQGALDVAQVALGGAPNAGAAASLFGQGTNLQAQSDVLRASGIQDLFSAIGGGLQDININLGGNRSFSPFSQARLNAPTAPGERFSL